MAKKVKSSAASRGTAAKKTAKTSKGRAAASKTKKGSTAAKKTATRKK